MNELKIYDIVLDSECNEMGMLCNSIVQNPAIEDNFYYFDKQEQTTLIKFDSNDLEHKIFGCVIRADYPIYRINEYGKEFFVRFSKEVIKDILLKYSKENLFNLVSIQHNGELLEGITLTEIFIKDSEKGIAPKGFEHIEEGSLFACYKVENSQVWDMIVKNELKGFSIELIADLKPTNEFIETEFNKQEPEQPKEENINSFIEDLYNYLIGEGIDNSEIEILFADNKKKLNEIIENAIDNETKVNIGLKGESKSVQGFIYTTNDNILSLYDERKDTWHIIQKNTIKSINTVNTNIVVNWDKAMANPDFQKILDIVRENPNPQPKATVGNDIIEQAIIEKKVVMVKYDDQTEFNCKTFRQGYILTKIINRKGNVCLRFFENSGATHSAEENPLPSWRCLRIDRLVDIKFAPDIFKPLTVPPNGWNPTTSVERDGAVVLLKSQF